MIFFVVRNCINNLLLKLYKQGRHNDHIKKILFIEPLKQGYGDIFFQTSLFDSLHKSGYEVNVLIKKDHDQILLNNPNVTKLYFWSIDDISKIISSKFLIVSLGRSTLRETFLFLCSFWSDKIFLDRDTKKWSNIFLENPNTLAWVIITEYYLKIKLETPLPQIYFSEEEKATVTSNRSQHKVGVVYGVMDNRKKSSEIERIIELLPGSKDIILFGKGKQSYSGKRKVNKLVNKLSYRQTLVELSTCETLIGTEGSLTQISASLIPNTLVIDNGGKFRENAHPNLLSGVCVYKEKEVDNLLNDI